MAGISPIVTVGFLFTPSLIVTAGFMGGEPPPPDVITGERGGWGPEPEKRKKKKRQPAPWERQDEASVRKSLMAVVEATASRKREAEERQDIEDLIRVMEKMGL